MTLSHKCIAVVALALAALSEAVGADCDISEEVKALDPVEVGFCDSDAVFIGTSEGAIETIRAATAEGSTTTKHFRTQRTTMKVTGRVNGKVPDKVTMIADLYAKDRDYVFEYGKTYLIFAKRLAVENEYAGAGACKVQPTLPIENAAAVLKQLEDHKKGRKKIDCKNIRAKAKP
jgi:hypothetical protein